MQAMTFMAPPQPLQVSMSILKTRLSRCAHVIDARRCAGVAGSSATLTLLLSAPFCRRDQRPVPTVGCEHPVEAG